MPKPQKVWMKSPAKSPKPAVPDAIKAEVEAKAMHLIKDVLKPRNIYQPEPDSQNNYITDIYAKWNRQYFYFISNYACPGPDAISPTFESKFARMEYVGDGKFALSFLRHTGAWASIDRIVSIDESMRAIQDDPWFVP